MTSEIGDQLVALVEKQDAKLLLVGERHAGPAISEHVIPGRQHGALLQLALGDTACCRRDQLELGDRLVPDSIDFPQARLRRVNDFRDRRSAGCACRETGCETAPCRRTPCWSGNIRARHSRTTAWCAASTGPWRYGLLPPRSA